MFYRTEYFRYLALTATALILFMAEFVWAASPETDFTFNANTGAITGYKGSGGAVECDFDREQRI